VEYLIYTFAFLLAFGGLLVFLGLLIFWDAWKRFYQSALCKGISEVARFGSVILGISAISDSLSISYRVHSIIAFAFSYLFWVLASLVGDHQKNRSDIKHADEVVRSKAELEIIRSRFLISEMFLSSFKEIMIRKKQIIWDQIALVADLSKTKAKKHDMIRPALDPQFQADQIVTHLAMFLRDQLPRGGIRDEQNFRVACYVAEDDYLKPFAAFDLAKQSNRFLRSFEQSRENFHLRCTDRPSEAVRCVAEERTLIIESCPRSLEELHPGQFRYLKSMVAYPIGSFGSSSEQKRKACIVIDTNIENYFKEADHLTIEAFMKQFAARLDLEYSVLKLLDIKSSVLRPKRKIDGTPRPNESSSS